MKEVNPKETTRAYALCAGVSGGRQAASKSSICYLLAGN